MYGIFECDIIVGDPDSSSSDKFMNNGIVIEANMEPKSFSPHHLLNDSYQKPSINIHVFYEKKLKKIFKKVSSRGGEQKNIDLKGLDDDIIVLDTEFAPRMDSKKHIVRFRGALAGGKQSEQEVSIDFTILLKMESEYDEAVKQIQGCFPDEDLSVGGNAAPIQRKLCKCGDVLMINSTTVKKCGVDEPPSWYKSRICPRCSDDFCLGENQISDLWRYSDPGSIARLKTAVKRQYDLVKERVNDPWALAVTCLNYGRTFTHYSCDLDDAIRLFQEGLDSLKNIPDIARHNREEEIVITKMDLMQNDLLSSFMDGKYEEAILKVDFYLDEARKIKRPDIEMYASVIKSSTLLRWEKIDDAEKLLAETDEVIKQASKKGSVSPQTIVYLKMNQLDLYTKKGDIERSRAIINHLYEDYGNFEQMHPDYARIMRNAKNVFTGHKVIGSGQLFNVTSLKEVWDFMEEERRGLVAISGKNSENPPKLRLEMNKVANTLHSHKQPIREIFRELLPKVGLELIEDKVDFTGDTLDEFIDNVLQEQYQTAVKLEREATSIELKTGTSNKSQESELARPAEKVEALIKVVSPEKRRSIEPVIKQLERQVAANPNDSKAAITLAYAHKEGGDPDKALAYFQSHTNNKEALLGFIATVIDQQMLRSAWFTLKDSIGNFMKDPDVLFAVGLYFWCMYLSPVHPMGREQNLQMAMRFTAGCLEMLPGSIRMDAFGARVAKELGDEENVRLGEKKCLSRNPTAARFWLNLPFNDSRWIPQVSNPFVDMEGISW